MWSGSIILHRYGIIDFFRAQTRTVTVCSSDLRDQLRHSLVPNIDVLVAATETCDSTSGCGTDDAASVRRQAGFRCFRFGDRDTRQSFAGAEINKGGRDPRARGGVGGVSVWSYHGRDFVEAAATSSAGGGEVTDGGGDGGRSRGAQFSARSRADGESSSHGAAHGPASGEGGRPGSYDGGERPRAVGLEVLV